MNKRDAQSKHPSDRTPLTDKVLKKMREGDGVPVCKEWTKLAAHARAMERLAYTYRDVSLSYLRMLKEARGE